MLKRLSAGSMPRIEAMWKSSASLQRPWARRTSFPNWRCSTRKRSRMCARPGWAATKLDRESLLFASAFRALTGLGKFEDAVDQRIEIINAFPEDDDHLRRMVFAEKQPHWPPTGYYNSPGNRSRTIAGRLFLAASTNGRAISTALRTSTGQPSSTSRRDRTSVCRSPQLLRDNGVMTTP